MNGGANAVMAKLSTIAAIQNMTHPQHHPAQRPDRKDKSGLTRRLAAKGQAR
jgi:hypothetical protein